MKRIMLLTLVLVAVSLIWGQTTLISDDIHTWTNRASYGSYTQTITVGAGTGIVSMTDCIVANAAAATGTCSTGRVQLKATTGILELPALPSIGRVEFHIAAGAAGRTVALQSYNGSSWDAITSFTGIGTVGTTFYYDVNNLSATTIRLATPSAALYVHDIIITDYAGGSATLAVLTTAIVSSITSTSAVSGGTITSDGGAVVTARGVCWNTSANPTISNSLSSDGSGTGSFVSSLTSLTASTLYYYRAYATNSQGTAYGEEYSFSTSGNSPPAVPTATDATNVGINSFTANWNAASGASSYRLDVSTSNTFVTMLASYNNLTVNSTSQAVSGLSANTPYYYRVRAYNSYGTSANSGTIIATTLANDPYGSYYAPVAGLSGTALKTGLHDLIDNNTYANYNGAKTFLFQTLDNVGGVVRCVYTGRDYTISGTYNGSSDPNTEHSYAQSWFGTAEASIKKADVHHLFITNMNVNSSRSNYPFGVVTGNATIYTYANDYVSKKGLNTSGATVFEPANQHKGNLARALLYFNTRYNMTLSQSGVDMLETLITWHNADPVDATELSRNTLVYGHQGNRNPFVDHPEYVASIWGGSTASTVVQFSPASAIVNEADGSITLSVQITNPSATTATTAQIVLSDGSASDVGNITTRNITFPVGSSNSQTISVTITNDSLLEGTETLVFSLVNVSGGTSATIGNYGSFNLDIEDNDIPTPVAIAATGVSYTGFTANWNAAAGITDYLFDLSTASDFSSFVIGYESYTVSATSLSITSLSEGTIYYYRLRAVFNESYGAYSDPVTVTTNAIVVLDPPVATDATAISHEGFTARWEAVSGAENYRLDVLTGTMVASELIMGFEGSTSFPAGWTNGSAYVANNSTYAHDSSYYAGLNLIDKFFYTPLVTNPVSCSFWTRNSAATANCTMIVQTSANGTEWTDHASYSAVPTDAGSVTTTYTQKTIALNLSGDYYVRWYMSARTGGSIYIDDINIACQTGSLSFVAGYENISVNSNIARISGLEPETTYSYRVRAENSSYTTGNSNTIEAVTTASVQGTGANTCISGAETTVLIPALSDFTNNNVVINPVLSSSDDFAVTVSTITGGIRYSFTSSNPSAYNAAYNLNHAGLGFSPATVLYRFNSVETDASSFTATATQTSLSISGLSGNGILEIDLLQAPPTLDIPNVTISINDGNVTLSWDEIPNATSYLIEASDTPQGSFVQIDSTSLFTWSESPSTTRFYQIRAFRD